MTELVSSRGGSPAGDREEGLGDDQGLVIHHPVEEQSHRCPLCGQTFSQQPSLVRHQKAHIGAGRTAAFVCPECGKAFSVKHNLEVHQRTHTGERPFPCPECGRCFSLKQNLLTHRRIHSGEKPHQCAQCGRCFRESRFLLNHQRTHARMPTPHPRRPGVFGERRPYFCPRCGKSFAREGSLKSHQRSHGHGHGHGHAAHLGDTTDRTSWPRTYRAYLGMETKNGVPWDPMGSWHEDVSHKKTDLWRCPVLVEPGIRVYFHVLVGKLPRSDLSYSWASLLLAS